MTPRLQPRPQPRTLYISEVHPDDCRCRECPPAPGLRRGWHPAATCAALLLAGIVTGQAIVVLIDWIAGGPGPFAVFGL